MQSFKIVTKPKKDAQISLDLRELNQNEIDLAVDFIEQAILGYIRMISKQKAAQMFEETRSKTIESGDTFIITYQIQTIGNDLMVAIGAAKNRIEELEHNRS